VIQTGGIVFKVKADVSDATKAFKVVGVSSKHLQNNLRQTTTLFGGLGNKLNAAKASLTSFAAAFGGVKLGGFAKDATLLAARVENLGTVLNNVGRISGLNSAQIRLVEDGVKKLGITTRAARASLSQLTQANISLAKATKLTRIAQDAAVIAGIDSSEAFNRLVVSVQRNDVRLLRNLGIVINLNQVYSKFAQTSGRTAAALTAFEKRQLLLNEVIKRGSQITGTYEASLRDSFKQFTSLNRLTEEATRVYGEQFIPVFEKVVKITGDWLKAFVAGQTAIGPRFIALVTVASAALLGLTVVMGGLVAVYAAFAALSGGAIIALTALTTAVVGGTVAWADHALEVAESERRLKDVEKQAANTGQALFDANKALSSITDITNAKPFGNFNEAEVKKLRLEVQKLATVFPDLAEDINRLAAKNLFTSILDLFERRVPAATHSAEVNIAHFSSQQAAAEERFRQELKDTFRTQEGFERRINALRLRELGRVRRTRDPDTRKAVLEGQEKLASDRLAAARAEEKFQNAIKGGTQAAIQNNAVLIKNTKHLREAADAVSILEAKIVQLRQAQLSDTAQTSQRQLQELEQAGGQAAQILSKLESQRARIFKGTNVQVVRDFEKAQSQLVQTRIKALEAIKTNTSAIRASALNEAKTVRDKALDVLRAQRAAEKIDEEKFQKDKTKVLRQFTKTQQGIVARGLAFEEAAIQALNDTKKATALTNENANKQLERQEELTARLLEQAQLEASGIGPRLLQIREKIAATSSKLAKADKRLLEIREGINKQLLRSTELTAKQIRDLIAGTLDPKILAPKTRQLLVRLKLVDRAVAANRKERLAREKVANEAFARERKRLSDKLLDEQKRLNKELLKAQDPKKFQESTLDGLRQVTEEFKRQTKDTKDFVREQQGDLLELGEVNKRIENQILTGRFKTVKEFNKVLSKLRDRAIPGIKDMRSEFDKFRDAAQKATTASDLKKIETIFGQTLQNQIRTSQFELKKLEVQLKEFQKIGKKKETRDNRIENQRLFNELVDQGVPIFKARQEIQRKEVAQRKELNAQEAELKKKVQDAQDATRALQKERVTLETQFQSALTKQTAEIARQVELRKQLVVLQKQEVANIQTQLASNKQAQQLLGKFTKGGVRGPGTTQVPEAPATSGKPTPSKQAGEASKKLSAAAQDLRDATRGDLDATIKGFTTTEQLLKDSEKNIQDRTVFLERWSARLTSDLVAGRQKMRQANMVRKKR